MGKKKPPKQMVLGWRIIRNILLKAGIPESHMKLLSSIWIDIYQNDPVFKPDVIAQRILSGMEDSLISEQKLRERLEIAKRTYAHILVDRGQQKKILDPQTVVFNALLANIVLRLKEKANVSDLSADLMSQVMQLPLTDNALIEVNRWCSQLINAILEDNPLKMDLNSIKTLLHFLYIWVCEELGSSTADQLFVESIRVVEMLPEASTCSPKSFL